MKKNINSYRKPTESYLELDPDQTLKKLEKKREFSGRVRSQLKLNKIE